MGYRTLPSRKHDTHVRSDFRVHPTFTVECSCGETVGQFDDKRKAQQAELVHLNDRKNAANANH